MKILGYLFFVFVISFTSCSKPEKALSVIVGKADSTLLAMPLGMCADKMGNLFVADAGNNGIKKVNAQGEVTVYAGSGLAGDKDGSLNNATFNEPSGVFIDKKGVMYVAGFGGQNIRKITVDGQVTTIAGTGEEGYRDGPNDQALFSSPRGICVDSKGNIFVADCWNHRIRKITPDGTTSTFAGGGKRGELVINDWKDGWDTTARFDAPCGLSIDINDNIYVADANNHCIRKITPEGYVSTIAGVGKEKGLVDGRIGESLLNVPTEVFVDENFEVYFSDTYNNCVRKIDENGIVITLAGAGKEGFTEDSPLNSLLNMPRGLCLIENQLYFVEFNNHIIRKLQL